jgi:hypothetical protein
VRRGADQVFTHQRRRVDLRHSDCDADRPSQTGHAGDRNEGRAAADRARFPVRMLVPGLYGFVSGTKWITDMELTTFAA